MGKRITVALDAMGGDYAPQETVKGAVDAVKELDAAALGCAVYAYADGAFRRDG